MTPSHRIPVAYLAHPVGPDGPNRTLNIRSAKLWLRALVEIYDGCAFSVPWLPYVETLDESAHRDRGIRDDLVGLERCDAVVAVGGRISVGMGVEIDYARRIGIDVIDLTFVDERAHLRDLRNLSRVLDALKTIRPTRAISRLPPT